jgi:hypothetical protein
MSKKRRNKKAHHQARAAAPTPARREVAVTSPTIVWEAHVFGAGGYQTASRFLLQGLIAENADVDVRPFWATDEMRQLDGE